MFACPRGAYLLYSTFLLTLKKRGPACWMLQAGGAAKPAPDLAAGSRHPTLRRAPRLADSQRRRSEEHTSELQSRLHLVCRLLLEKKKTNLVYIADLDKWSPA